MAYRHIADRHVRIDLHAHFINGLFGQLCHLLVIQSVQTISEYLGDHTLFPRFAVEQDIFSGREAGDQGKFLMDHADTCMQGIEGGVEADLLTVNQHVALISAGLSDHVHTKEKLHQGALAGAVFAHKTQNLAGVQLKIDISQDLVSEEILLYISHLQQRSIIFYHIVPTYNNGGGNFLPLFPILAVFISDLFNGEILLRNLNLSGTHEMSGIAHDVGVLIYQEYVAQLNAGVYVGVVGAVPLRLG